MPPAALAASSTMIGGIAPSDEKASVTLLMGESEVSESRKAYGAGQVGPSICPKWGQKLARVQAGCQFKTSSCI